MADQSLITDLLLFVWHHRPPTTLVLISNDPHFSPILTRVRDLGYRVVLVHSQDEVRDALRRSADIALHLKRDVLQLTQQQLQADEEQEQVEEQREMTAEQELKKELQTQSMVKQEPLSCASAAPSVSAGTAATTTPTASSGGIATSSSSAVAQCTASRPPPASPRSRLSASSHSMWTQRSAAHLARLPTGSSSESCAR